MEETGSESCSGDAWAEESLLPGGASPVTISNSDDDLVSVNERFAKADPAPTTLIFIPHPVHAGIFLADRVFLFPVRPGRVKTVIPVPFERPRSLEMKR